jgi:3-methyladenine DNA glycosylase/8-oxoguanine DNA glycosylase
VWRATHTPDGPGTIHLRSVDAHTVDADAWGPGAEWLVASAPGLVGAHDALDGFEPGHHPVVARVAHELGRVRLTRTERVLDALVPAILEQKVTGYEARRAWRAVVYRFGTPAPGPVSALRVAPTRDRLAGIGSYALHPLGVERRRAETIRRAVTVAHRLEEAVAMGSAVLDRRLRAIAGIGPWTSAEVRRVVLGDADAVSVGDYHLPNMVAWALAGEPRADDRRMLELLEPFAGHRGRVVRLLEASGAFTAPRHGPRMPAREIARH